MRTSLRVCIACLLAGCDATAPARVHVSTTANPNRLGVSETTTITVSMINISASTIQVRPANDHCGYFFSIVDSNERRAELEPLVCSLVLQPPMDLRPGETVTYARAWEPSSATIDGQPLAAGDYMIRPANLGEVSIAAGAFALLQLKP